MLSELIHSKISERFSYILYQSMPSVLKKDENKWQSLAKIMHILCENGEKTALYCLQSWLTLLWSKDKNVE
jgi:hypothetical protein